MITRIAIENFKGIGERQEIVIRPLTLLFGPNSAGKSTVLHALHYAREIFNRHNLDADATESGGDFVDLGGYLNLRHRDEVETPDREVVLRFDLDMRSTNLMQLVPVDECLLPLKRAGEVAEDELDLSTIGDDIAKSAVEITIAWSARRNCPYVKRYAIELNDEPFAEILGSDSWSDANSVRNINVRHPLIAWKDTEDEIQFASNGVLDTLCPPLRSPVLEMYYDEGVPVDEMVDVRPPVWSLVMDQTQQFDRKTIRCVQRLDDSTNRAFMLLIGRLTDTHLLAIHGGEFDQNFWTQDEADVRLKSEVAQVDEIAARFIPLNDENDALPNLDRPLSLAVMAESSENPVRDDFRIAFRQLMDRLIRGPGVALRESLREFRYVGPLRSTVPRNHAPSRFPDPQLWPSGEAAWNELCRDPDDLCFNVSTWLADDDKLDTGYRIRVDDFREISVDSPLWGLLRSGKLIDDAEVEEIKKKLDSLRRGKRVVLTRADTGTDLQLKDVGEGLTQMIPVIVAVLDPAGGANPRKGSLVGIEQPELHLNPRQQAALGDLMIFAALQDPRNTLIIETHSQPLILRILKRMRETATKGTPPLIQVHPNDISVWYVDNEVGATELTEIRVGQTGEFLQQWPDDFFDQAFLERFG